jgi:hypothetical protein
LSLFIVSFFVSADDWQFISSAINPFGGWRQNKIAEGCPQEQKTQNNADLVISPGYNEPTKQRDCYRLATYLISNNQDHAR